MFRSSHCTPGWTTISRSSGWNSTTLSICSVKEMQMPPLGAVKWPSKDVPPEKAMIGTLLSMGLSVMDQMYRYVFPTSTCWRSLRSRQLLLCFEGKRQYWASLRYGNCSPKSHGPSKCLHQPWHVLEAEWIATHGKQLGLPIWASWSREQCTEVDSVALIEKKTPMMTTTTTTIAGRQWLQHLPERRRLLPRQGATRSTRVERKTMRKSMRDVWQAVPRILHAECCDDE